ncbi:MAG: RidA family protein [Candidatus Latescibacteria bacterium]|nr:RidA family protein [Candidatus Latescibacterota bacterium]
MKKTFFCILVIVMQITFFAWSVPAWEHGVKVGKTLYLAGRGDQFSREETSSPPTYPERVRQCLENIRGNLKSAGMDMENVVKAWVFLDDIRHYGEMNSVFAEFFPKGFPTRTTIAVGWLPGGAQIEITCIAYSDLSEKRVAGKPPSELPGLPFSSGIIAGKTLYISGQGDHLHDGGHPPTFEEQVRQSMRNVENILKEAGLDFRHVVWSNVYLDNYDNLGIVNKVYSEFFEFGNEPARATVFVDALPVGSHIEITCIATTDLSQRKVVRPASMRSGPEGLAMTASPGVWAGDTLYLSSQAGYNPITGSVPGGMESQFKLMMQNHMEVIREAGLGIENVVSGTVYMANGDINYKSFNDLYNPYFESTYTVRTCIQGNSGYEKNNHVARTSFILSRKPKTKIEKFYRSSQ